MPDIVDQATRSRMMSGIRSSNTKPEILIRKALHRLGYRFRLNSKVGKVKPDVVLKSLKVAVFTHGCYWHQHEGCRMAYSDRPRSEKWEKKFSESKGEDIYFPKEIRIYDEIEKGNRSVIVIQKVDLRPLEKNIFTKAWLESKSR